MGSTGKVHCSDKEEKCIEFTSVVDPNEVFNKCMNIYTEKTYHELLKELLMKLIIYVKSINFTT